MRDETQDGAVRQWSIRWRRAWPSLPDFNFPRPSLLILLALCGLLFFKGIGSRELWASHEARAAQNAQRMLDDGNWLLPRLYDGQVELQKPPGFYWLVAAVGRARGGVDPWAVRLPAAVAGVLTVLMVWWHLQRRGRPTAAFVAAAMLAGAVHFTGTARIGRIDVPLACVVTAIILVSRDAAAERVTRDNRGDAPTFRDRAGSRSVSAARLTVLGVLIGAALLLKGPIGGVLPAAVLGVYWLIERVQLRRLIVPALVVGIIGLAVAAPWFIWANARTDGEFFRVFFVYHNFNRALGGAEALAGRPWWFYLPRFAADFLPWTPVLLAVLGSRRWRGDADARFGLIWLAATVAVLSLARFKRADYLLPAYSGAAIYLGCALERWYLSQSPRVRVRAAGVFLVTLALLPAGWIAFDRMVTDREEAAHDQRPFAQRVRELAPRPDRIILFRVESHLLAFHLGRPVHTLVEWAELNAAAREPGPHFVVTGAEVVEDVRGQVAVPLEVVARSEDTARGRPIRPLVLLRIGNQTCPAPPTE